MTEQQTQAQSAHPTDHHIRQPIGLSNERLLTSTDTDLAAPNVGAHTGTTPVRPRRKQRLTPRDIDELATWLSERDYAILRSVDEHQFLTVRQIEILHFAANAPTSGSRIARRTLARLRSLQLLAALPRRVGGMKAGSAGLVHYLDDTGNRLLHGARTRRVYGPSDRFVSHRLAVADAHLALITASRDGQLDLADSAVEPKAWRRHTGLGAARLTLKADLYAEIAIASDSEFVQAWFIEVDLGTESIPTVLKKCHDYEAYRRTGIEQEHGGFPLVIWSMTHADPQAAKRRRRDLQKAIERDRVLPRELFRITAPDQLITLLTAGGDL